MTALARRKRESDPPERRKWGEFIFAPERWDVLRCSGPGKSRRAIELVLRLPDGQRVRIHVDDPDAMAEEMTQAADWLEAERNR